ncbi:hypothetical protein XM38_001920 [Halomicronema hongdechloris C2206]|uniref:Uncharacterized protein n=1 Tax=Halomicronema hongdechloris C2206 TaxID=1641165 RepID=A0A1Z3HG76_9CYAN|nr:hypothetical protein [Halomicronema hongdechloris]ASC69265.1 hypothetical protein XM38_001920 [Halomicronema hongdechloris C2206]
MTSSLPRQFHRAPNTIADYLHQMDPEVLQSLSLTQRSEVERILAQALPKPAPKIVDLRFRVDLILSRFYVVLLVGKDRRRQRRHYPQSALNRLGNFIAAVVLLLSLNLAVSGGLFLAAYLVKSAVGINLLPGHMGDYLR